MAYPDPSTALDDPVWGPPFKQWARDRKGMDLDDERTLFEAVDVFKADPVVAKANLAVMVPYIGFAEYGWNRVSEMPVPQEIREMVTEKVRENIPRDDEGKLDNIGADAVATVPVAPDAFDPLVQWAKQRVENAFYEFVKGFEPSDEQYQAVYDRNYANVNSLEDGGQLGWIQRGDIVLIGEGHDDFLTAFVRSSPESGLGNLMVEKGGVLSTGSLKVWGCKEQNAFKEAVAQRSKKSVKFFSAGEAAKPSSEQPKKSGLFAGRRT
ncbi:MAG TPA: hypothetical protein VFH58_17035 [Acidimicrobiales bacterium]|nr:hypothetical protein [Acidimicrobiales bacterium]